MAATTRNRPEENAADRARSDLGLGLESPLADILAAVEDLAAVPVTVAVLSRDVAGMYIRRRGDPYIFVNGVFRPVRQRFTLAHEFGHHYLGHRQRVDGAGDVFGNPRDPDEVAANYFAGAFLAPLAGIRNWADRHAELDRDAAFVVRAAAFFGIAAMSALIRLTRAGCLTRAEATRLRSAIDAGKHHGMLSALGVSQLTDELARIHEHGAFPRLPARMTATARRARDRLLIDDQELAELLQGRQDLVAPGDGGAEDDLPL